jgi:hypothetical protein
MGFLAFLFFGSGPFFLHRGPTTNQIYGGTTAVLIYGNQQPAVATGVFGPYPGSFFGGGFGNRFFRRGHFFPPQDQI